MDQLCYTWATTGLEGRTGFQIVAATRSLANRHANKTRLALRACYLPVGLTNSSALSFGWFDHDDTRVVFRRTPLEPGKYGRPGNFACHVLIGPRDELPARALLRRARSSFWWQGNVAALMDLEGWLLPEAALSDVADSAQVPDPWAPSGSLFWLVRLATTSESVTLPVHGDQAVACLLGVEAFAPRLVETVTFSSFESPPAPLPFTVYGAPLCPAERHPPDDPMPRIFASDTATAREARLAGSVVDAALRMGVTAEASSLRESLAYAAALAATQGAADGAAETPNPIRLAPDVRRATVRAAAVYVDDVGGLEALLEKSPSLDAATLAILAGEDQLSLLSRALALRALARRPDASELFDQVVRRHEVVDELFRLRPSDSEVATITTALTTTDVIRLLDVVRLEPDEETSRRISSALLRRVDARTRADWLLRELAKRPRSEESAALMGVIGWETLSELIASSGTPYRELRQLSDLAAALSTNRASRGALWGSLLTACEPFAYRKVEALARRIAVASRALCDADARLAPAVLRISIAALVEQCPSDETFESSYEVLNSVARASTVESAHAMLDAAAELQNARVLLRCLRWIDRRVSEKEIPSERHGLRRKTVRLGDAALEAYAVLLVRRVRLNRMVEPSGSEASAWLSTLFTLARESEDDARDDRVASGQLP